MTMTVPAERGDPERAAPGARLRGAHRGIAVAIGISAMTTAACAADSERSASEDRKPKPMPAPRATNSSPRQALRGGSGTRMTSSASPHSTAAPTVRPAPTTAGSNPRSANRVAGRVPEKPSTPRHASPMPGRESPVRAAYAYEGGLARIGMGRGVVIARPVRRSQFASMSSNTSGTAFLQQRARERREVLAPALARAAAGRVDDRLRADAGSGPTDGSAFDAGGLRARSSSAAPAASAPTPRS